MGYLESAFLGALQGVTEFLPISSDGHLVVAEALAGVSLQGRDALGFDILLHAGSLLALLLCTGKQWIALLRDAIADADDARRMLLLIVVATVPGAIAGLFFADAVAQMRFLPAAAAGFAATGFALLIGELAGGNRAPAQRLQWELRWWMVFAIGLAQALALLPGVSRSGSTIAVGMILGLSRRDAFSFSFLMAAPILAGAIGKNILDVAGGVVTLPPASVSVAGFVAATIVSAGAYLLLRTWVTRLSLSWFALYLFPLALVLLWIEIGMPHTFEAAEARVLLERYGAMAVFLFAMLESTPPFSVISPGVVVMLLAGAVAGDLRLLMMFAAAGAAGVLLPSVTFYFLGVQYGRSIAHRFHLTDSALSRAESLSVRYGGAGVIIGQFIGLARPAVAFIAGTVRLRRRVFLPCAALGAILLPSAYLGLGYLFRSNLDVVIPVVTLGGTALVILTFLFGGAWGVGKAIARRR
ncbi:MAG: undecaprenyl-diphosphatase [Candidatus Peregrinibacteria bacterium Gr01-1014_25]|nr:MAG: undecaprenyl-diphosphatase [Candidatus Peregrinibacteria bacterium Gr01-1014_25]